MAPLCDWKAHIVSLPFPPPLRRFSARAFFAVSLYFLYDILGASVFAGLGMMLLMVPINSWTAVKMRAVQIVQMGLKDRRIRFMDEVLAGMKVIKLYAWENSFLQRILAVRAEELRNLRRSAYFGAIQSFTWTCAPFLVSLASFAVYAVGAHSPTSTMRGFSYGRGRALGSVGQAIDVGRRLCVAVAVQHFAVPAGHVPAGHLVLHRVKVRLLLGLLSWLLSHRVD